MFKLYNKLRSKNGESFVEILIAILIVAFGCMLVATLYSTSLNLNTKVAQEDDSYYGVMSDIEKMEGDPTPGKAVISDESGNDMEVEIEIFGNEDNASYKRDDKRVDAAS